VLHQSPQSHHHQTQTLLILALLLVLLVLILVLLLVPVLLVLSMLLLLALLLQDPQLLNWLRAALQPLHRNLPRAQATLNEQRLNFWQQPQRLVLCCFAAGVHLLLTHSRGLPGLLLCWAQQPLQDQRQHQARHISHQPYMNCDNDRHARYLLCHSC
jgi:hypothetical protein